MRIVLIQFSRVAPAGAQTMETENEEAEYNQQQTNDAKP
jgi:hypothetical protein